MTQRRTAIILIDHGSRLEAANTATEQLAVRLRDQLGAGVCHVAAAHMELDAPTMADAFRECKTAGAEHVLICPLFITPGRHKNEDIPKLATASASQHAGLTWSIMDELMALDGFEAFLVAATNKQLQKLQASKN